MEMAEKEKKSAATRSVARWDPFEELDLFHGWDPFPLRGRRARELFGEMFGRGEGGAVVPAVEIGEDDDRYVVTLEVPGAKKEDITVETHENVLTIRGEKRSEREEKREQSRYVERRYGSFSRSFTLPSNAAADRVAASFKDGVLTVELPKLEEAKPKAVSIKS
jgi:HSP20 family protein